MPAERLTDLPRATDSNSSPLSGAKWFFYESGTLTPQSVYTTSALSVAHANPVVADASGLFDEIFFDASLTYRGILKDADGNTIKDADPINSGIISALAASSGAASVGFVQSGTGSVARTVQAKARERLSTADKDGAFLAQLQSIGADLAAGGRAFIPTGTHTLSGTFTFAGQRLNLEGEGRQASIISFSPGATDVALDLDSGGGGGQNQSAIRRVGFTSADSSDKTAIRLYNVANVEVSEVAIASGAWAGSGSIGVNTLGRQFVAIKQSEILCARPVVFSPNPAFASLAVDHFLVEHCELGTTLTTGSTIELENGVPISNLTIRNNAIMLGKNGIKGADSTSATASFCLTIENNRFEQADDATGYCIDLDYSTSGLQNLVCSGNRYDIDRNGVKLRGVKKMLFIGDQFPQSGGGVACDITIPVGGELHFIGCQGNGGTRTITNGRCVHRSVDANSLNWTEHWVYDASFASGAQQSDVYHGGVPFTLANDATQAIADNTFTGLVFLSSSEDVSACFALRGATASTAEVFDPDGFYNVTKDNASSLNVYWDAGTSRYVIQNKRGGSVDVSVFRIGTTA